MGLASLCNEETSDLQGEKQLPARAITTVCFRAYNWEKHGEVKAELQSSLKIYLYFFFLNQQFKFWWLILLFLSQFPVFIFKNRI